MKPTAFYNQEKTFQHSTSSHEKYAPAPRTTVDVNQLNSITVVKGNDSRLTNARPASDVSAWAKKSKLAIGDIPTGTTATTVALGNHTHSAATTSAAGFMSAADKTKLNGLVTNATHTGDVTGSVALTIANDKVTNAKLANMPTARIKGRVSSNTGDPEDLTQAQVRMFLGLGSSAYVATSSFRSNTWTPKIGDLPTGQSGTTVALGNHTHIASEVGGRSDTWLPTWSQVTSKPTWIGNSKPTYNLSEITETTTYKRFTQTEKNKLDGIATGAQVNRTIATTAQAQAGTDNTTVMTPLRVKQAISASGGGGGGSANPLFNTSIPAYDYDIRTTAISNQGRGRFIVVVSTSAYNAGFMFKGNRISGPNLNNTTNYIGYSTGFFIYEVVTMPYSSFFAIKASGQSEYSMYSSFRIDFSSPGDSSDYIDMVAWEV